MQSQQLRELDGPELRRQLSDMQEQLFRLKFQIGMGQLEGLKKYREIKKDRARMLGVLREREIDPAKEQAAAAAAAAAAKPKAKRATKKAKKDE